MQLGKMYLVKEFFWFLFPTKELAGGFVEAAAAGDAQIYAKLFSERYNCNVSFVEENTYVVLLEESERCYKLLDCNGNIGWIGCSYFSKYFEIVKE